MDVARRHGRRVDPVRRFVTAELDDGLGAERARRSQWIAGIGDPFLASVFMREHHHVFHAVRCRTCEAQRPDLRRPVEDEIGTKPWTLNLLAKPDSRQRLVFVGQAEEDGVVVDDRRVRPFTSGALER